LPEVHAKVDEVTFALLEAVANAADAAEMPWLVTGASARVLLLESVYGMEQGRATEDIDFAVMVESWPHFDRLVEDICSNPQFARDPKQAQRIRYLQDFYLDLVPFGGVESEDAAIEWPPHGDVVMSVAGFREALADAIKVRVNEAIDVPVGSPAGLLMLKLLAWGERRLTQPNRDAADIAYFLRNGTALIMEAVLFEQHLEVVAEADYDIDLAASFVLGAHIGSLTSSNTRKRLASILDPLVLEGEDALLVRDVSVNMPAFDKMRVLGFLIQLRSGFEAAKPSAHTF
jgi:predicted nucleotidyltransferase